MSLIIKAWPTLLNTLVLVYDSLNKRPRNATPPLTNVIVQFMCLIILGKLLIAFNYGFLFHFPSELEVPFHCF